MFGNAGKRRINDFPYGEKDGKNENEDMVLEDNYFDMNAGEKRIRIINGEPVGRKVRSVYDI